MTHVASRAFVLALVLAAGCTESDPSTQVLTGKVTTAGALAVRAVAGDTVITATQVRSDGSFTLVLPVGGDRYRLEVLTTSGVRHVFSSANGALADLTFRVCQPIDPYDMGGIGPDGTSGMGGGGMGGGGSMQPPSCGPNDPDCTMQPPWPECSETMDPTCPWPQPCAPDDPSCTTPCEPGDANCGMCSNPMDPTCGMPPTPGCTDPMDPYCFCDANGDCPPPYCGGTEPGGMGGMGPDEPTSNDVMCPPPPPEPCFDPMDPTTCTNPCDLDPAACGCTMDDPNCWPTPEPPSCNAIGEMCEPGGPGGMTPEHPPGDFGCDDDAPPMDNPTMPSPDDPTSPDDPPPMPQPGEPMGL